MSASPKTQPSKAKAPYPTVRIFSAFSWVVAFALLAYGVIVARDVGQTHGRTIAMTKQTSPVIDGAQFAMQEALGLPLPPALRAELPKVGKELKDSPVNAHLKEVLMARPNGKDDLAKIEQAEKALATNDVASSRFEVQLWLLNLMSAGYYQQVEVGATVGSTTIQGTGKFMAIIVFLIPTLLLAGIGLGLRLGRRAEKKAAAAGAK